MSVLIRAVVIGAHLLLARTHLPQYSRFRTGGSGLSLTEPTETLTVATTTTTYFTTTEITIATQSVGSFVTNSTTDEAGPQWVSLPSDLRECNFRFLNLSASLLEPPLNIADGINLQEWESISRQLNELRNLLVIHYKTLIRRHGAREFYNLHAGLDDLIDKPLKYGCNTLQQLLVGLFSVRHTSNMKKSERLVILAKLLQETEADLHFNIMGGKVGNFVLPSWARKAPELRSEFCPNRNCFKIGNDTIELVTYNIQRNLLDGVQKIMAETDLSLLEKMHFALRQTRGAVAWWYFQFKLFFTKEILAAGFIYSFLLFFSKILISRYFNFELAQWGVTPRAVNIH